MSSNEAAPPPRAQPASTVRHKNLPPWLLSAILPACFLLFVLSSAGILTLAWFTARRLFGPGLHCTIVVLVPLVLLGRRVYNFVRGLVESGRALETGEEPVSESDDYQDETLMGEIWDVHSPYNHQNRGMNEGGGRSKDISVRQEIESEAISFQPKEGYCGPASVNTILLSLDPPMAIPYTVLPKQFSMDALYTYLEAANSSMNGGLFDRIEMVRTTEAMTMAEFRRHLLQANSPGCRVLVNFHRKPLFASGGAHWSPIGGVLSRKEHPVDAALVLDVNKSYGPYIVPIDRLFGAVRTKNVYGAYRGLIKLYLKIDSDSSADEKTD